MSRGHNAIQDPARACAAFLRRRLERFAPAFGRGISPSDIDGVVESRGRFLWSESKLPGEATSLGQEHLYEALARRGDHVLFIITDEAGDILAAEMWHGDQRSGVELATEAQLVAWCELWFLEEV